MYIYNLKGISALLLLTIMVMVGITLIENNLAVLVIGFLLLLLGGGITIILSKKHVNNSLFLFYFFFLLFFLYTIFVHYVSEYNYDKVNLLQDELFFYGTSNSIIHYLNAGYSFFDIAGLFEYHEMPAYIYLIGNLAIFANTIGENSVFVQKLLVVFFASLIPATLYMILKLYVKEKDATNGAIFYGLVIIMSYSSMILRDLPVALTYIIFFWVILQKVSVKNILILFSVSFFSLYLRTETGLFLIGMSSVYLIASFNQLGKNNFVKIVLILFFLLLALAIFFGTDLHTILTRITESSQKDGLSKASSGSFGAKLMTLPYGLNILGMTIFSQMQPFPAWVNFERDGIFSIVEALGGIFWFITWGYILYGIAKLKILASIDIKLKSLFYFAIIYIMILGSSDMVIRRMIAAYPLLFIIAFLTYIKLSNETKKLIFNRMLLIYLTLMILFILLKANIGSGYAF
jgi:hypothetical protein